ncbi:MAG TPA: hypothetical protein VMH22_13920 [bacterium]|nr:hypothetical protein [bacterium]
MSLPHHSRSVRMALVGLLVVAAISVAAGSGRKPAKEVQSAVSLRHISTSEAMDILQKFPELVPSFLAARRNDAEYMAGTFGFVEVSEPTLARVFPAAHFYLGHDFTSPPRHPYLMAIDEGKGYSMPYGFNRLLIDNGMNVTNKNIIELAEAFIIAAIYGEQGPSTEVTFLGATRAKYVISGDDYDACVRVQIGQQTEEWFFSLPVGLGQFGTVERRGPKGYIDEYNPAEARPRHGPGQVNPTPNAPKQQK